MEGLDLHFQSALFEWIEELRKKNLCIQIKQGYISPSEQAKLWKSGHSDSDIDQKIQYLKSNKLHTMAELIANAYATVGPFVTNLVPGCSWHNWGKALAFNLKTLEDNKILSVHNPEFKIASRYAKRAGLFTGDQLEPRKLKPDIIQFNIETLPTDCFTLQALDEKLKEWYDKQTD